MSPEPSLGHDIQATNVQALVAAQAQAQAMREFLGALELSQLTGAPPPVFHEFFNVLPPQLQNISPPIDPALLSNTPSGASPGPEFKHPKFKSKRGTNIQPKPKSLVYLILPSSCFEDRREVPALPQGYMPVSEDNEELELICRAPKSDELDWNYLSKLSESQRLAIRSGCNPDDHAEHKFSLEQKRSCIRKIFKAAEAKYGFDKVLVEDLCKCICKTNIKNNNHRGQLYIPDPQPPTSDAPQSNLRSSSPVAPVRRIGNPLTKKQNPLTKKQYTSSKRPALPAATMKEKSIQPARDAIQLAHNTFTYQQHRVVVQTNNTSSPALQSESQQTVHETEVDDSQAHSQAQLHTTTSISSTPPPFNQNQRCNSVDVGLDEYPSSQTSEVAKHYANLQSLRRPSPSFSQPDSFFLVQQIPDSQKSCRSPAELEAALVLSSLSTIDNASSHTNPGTPVTSSQPNSPKRQSSSSIEPPLKKCRGRPKKTFTTMDVILQPQANVPDCESPESDIDETQLMEARPDTIHISSTRNHYGTRTNCKSSAKVIEELAYKHQETSAKNKIKALCNGKVKLQNKKVSGRSQRT
ncbi:hypothetical protein BGX38DRAFT_1269922 [Terfezia claveryi]|nr:hypothetical protein BGX38DRAFT_1269922 [Terfezia claveryi]